MYNKTILLSLSLACMAGAFAQTDTAASHLNEVVVTGQYAPQSLKRSVYQVRVITADRISKLGAVKLQDVLANELNIRFSQDLALGGSDITMQGLKGQNVKILIDGVPVIGRQGTSNEININQVDVNSIQRIELVEGPMSVVYGADALAGVINIITSKPKDNNLKVSARVHEETVAKEYGLKEGIHNQYLGATWQHQLWDFSAGLTRNNFGGWQGDAPEHDKKWNPKDQWLANAAVGYRKGGLQLRYRLDMLDETIKNPGIFENNEALDQQYISKRWMQQVQANNTFNNKWSMQAVASYSNYSRRTLSTIYNKTTGQEYLSLGAGQQDKIKFDGGMFRGSVVYKASSTLAIQPGVDINYESGSGERIGTISRSITDYAFFITSEINPSDHISLKPGLRVVHNSVYDAPPVIPSLNTKFVLTKSLDFRLSYARGFRAPSLRELYFYFHDASHSIDGNPNLQAELSHSFNGVFNWAVINHPDFTYTIIPGGFFNNVNNMIDYAVKADDPTITTYINIAKYKTAGFTLNNNIKVKNFQATAGFAYTGRYNQYATTNKDLPSYKWSPEANANVSYTFSKIGLDVNLFYKYTGRLPYYEQATVDNQLVVRLASVKDYHWADFTLNKKIGKLVTLNAGVRNLFNVVQVNTTALGGGAHTETGARPIGYGRSYFAGLAFNWNHALRK